MKDLFVNFIGAIFFAVFGYFYDKSQKEEIQVYRKFCVQKIGWIKKKVVLSWYKF